MLLSYFSDFIGCCISLSSFPGCFQVKLISFGLYCFRLSLVFIKTVNIFFPFESVAYVWDNSYHNLYDRMQCFGTGFLGRFLFVEVRSESWFQSHRLDLVFLCNMKRSV